MKSGPTGPSADPAPHRDGQTTPRVDGEPAPRLPHERDESSDSQSAAPDPVMQQAHADVATGLTDTDRGPVLDELYESAVRVDKTPDRGSPA